MNKKQSRAFEAFVESEGDRLLRIAVLMTSNHQLAEDAAQRTLERLAERWDRVEYPKAFCRKVLNNLLTDDARAAADPVLLEETLLPLASRVAFGTSGRQSGNYRRVPHPLRSRG